MGMFEDGKIDTHHVWLRRRTTEQIEWAKAVLAEHPAGVLFKGARRCLGQMRTVGEVLDQEGWKTVLLKFRSGRVTLAVRPWPDYYEGWFPRGAARAWSLISEEWTRRIQEESA